MKKSLLKKITAGAAFISAGAIGLVGCGAAATKEAPAKTESKDVKAFIGSSIFDANLNPVKGGMSYGYSFINEALLKVNPKSEYVASLADEWKISEDALTYTYKLKKDIKFSNGTLFDADDVVFTYEQVKKNQADNEYVDLSALDTVKKLDDYTVEFKLKEAYSPFLDTTAQLQIVPSDGYDAETFSTKPIGTGAYKVAEYKPNEQIILEPNEYYHGKKADIGKITIVNIDPDAAMANAKSGQLDIVMVPTNYANEKINGMTLQKFDTMDVRNVSLPVLKPQVVKNDKGEDIQVGNAVTSDKAFREAISIGINRKAIIQNAFQGIGIPASNFTDNLLWASTEEIPDNQPEKAKALLEAAGWKVGADGIRVKDGLKAEIDVYAPGGDQDRYNLAVALAEDAKNLGIKINAKTGTWDEVDKVMNKDSVVFGWGQYSPTVLKSLFDSKGFLDSYNNVVGYNNPEVDKLINSALHANTQKAAIKDWKEVQKIADSDYPYLYLVNIQHCYFVKDNLNVSNSTQIPHPHGHGTPIICNISDWSWK